jgi:hypothetical protein
MAVSDGPGFQGDPQLHGRDRLNARKAQFQRCGYLAINGGERHADL